jgi:GTP cyclohydrolase III
MKKSIFIIVLFVAFGMQSFAQMGMPKLPGKITDIAGSTNKITSAIAKETGSLSKTEEKGVSDATSEFLGNYNNLLPKMKMDPAGFTSALDKLKSGYDGKLKTALGAAKFAKFAGTGTGAGATKVLNMLM